MKDIIFRIGLALLLVVSFTGCNDFLDTTPTDRISDEIVWSNKENVTLYVNGFYPYIDRYGNFGSSQFNGNLTEGLTETLKYGSYVPGSKAGDANLYVFDPEGISPSGNLLDTWAETYERIRRVNEFLVGLGKYSELDEETNKLFEGQARFFRAFLYFQLAKRHGGVILYTDMDLQKDKPRSSEEETWDLIENDLDFAASVLPKQWDQSNQGRVTKGAAFAFKSRAMLYAKRWEAAKNAADSVFNLGVYSLTERYEDAWKGGNAESILEYNYLITGPNHTFDKDYATFGEIENQGGSGTPTQEMVEAYEKSDGTKLDWSPWHVEGGTTTPPPYNELEPRFHATVIYNGSVWQGKVMENSVDGTNGRFMGYREDTYPKGRTTTGYYLKKFRDEAHTDLVTYNSTQPWVELRLAEVYLNRAEANYNLGNLGEALDDLNEIRKRVGLPAKEGLSEEEVFEAIRHERKIELAYEGHLYWDMRRWRLAHIEYNDYRVHGLKISPAEGGYLYEYVDCDMQDRKFLEKTYVLPVPYSELANNSAIEQYDEWK
ncbi:RagB/SusD family nutrient uptake outer membrane protein [Thermophagus xiamenensis]|uniref:Starch-binding associating with outer membrane n=1 Tax=Thermophagus xiamenensis TaxID=385682 RepID=A0A1I1USY6_9BACT|nr:RagB/SusD family nutrient uptake outer membrane protein [Thermophagus xiamenensis]SFD73887.1 Starch-binding associating with outer membrane [Thermophagus xiamenensis]